MTSKSDSFATDDNGLGAAEWVGARGDKWAAQLAGMEAMLAPVDAPLLEALRLDAPLRIADVGCGGGGTTLAIVRAAPAGSVVHGFDISPALVEVARGRAHDAVQFDVANIASSTPAAPYQRLVSRFGTMFFDDPPAAFENLARWLSPGGRFVFAVWAAPSDNVWMTSVKDVVARFIDVPGQDPEAPGPFRYASVDKLLRLLEQSGLSQLEVSSWRGSLPIGGGLPAGPAASFALASFASLTEQLARSGQALQTQVEQALGEQLASHEVDGVVRMDAGVHFVTGWRE